ncbi:hypothetical protein [Macrococcoides canis]|uniref:hypothetical protein n=1 Tax=Macrococcoides canis TaxID=1855823 RepID=UPI00165D902F|nr:hypothetical protein [Macrococcus canis]QNR07020.1 hypothetical protein GL258_01690 [Macrococcus canis]
MKRVDLKLVVQLQQVIITLTEPIIVKVKDVIEIYATGEKDGKKVTTKKVKVTKSLVHEYDDLHIKLIFEE